MFKSTYINKAVVKQDGYNYFLKNMGVYIYIYILIMQAWIKILRKVLSSWRVYSAYEIMPFIYIKIKTMLQLSKNKEVSINSEFLYLCIYKNVKFLKKLFLVLFCWCFKYILHLPLGNSVLFIRCKYTDKGLERSIQIINSDYTCVEENAGEWRTLPFSILHPYFPLIICYQNVVSH